MKYSYSVPLRVPAPAVDLATWVFSLSDEDYQAASPNHRAAGVTVSDGVRGTVNVESIGGTLLVQHYREVSSSRSGFDLLSKHSRAYLLHLVPVGAVVRWLMDVASDTAETSTLRCTVEVDLSGLVNLIAVCGGTPFFLRRHVRGELAGFARDLERKYAPAGKAT